jgi:large subunit ribosomal protein L25
MPTALKTTVGRTLGSAASRRLRTADHIPAVIYGHGMQPIPVTVERRDLRVALSGPAGVNTILELHVDGTTYPAIVKEMQRDPMKRTVRHVDFQQISLTEKITVQVPLHLKGVAKAVISDGGLVDPVSNTVEIRATANNIPNDITVDISAMGMDDVIRLGDLQLPDGVSIVGDPEFVIVTVVSTKPDAVAPVAAAEPTEAAADAAAAAAAPAAENKPAS